MIGLLDPALFLPVSSTRSPKEVQKELDLIIQICRKYGVKLAPLSEYWKALWSTLVFPLEKQLPPEAKRSIQELRKLAEKSDIDIPHLQPLAGKVWRKGFAQLFNATVFSRSWEEPMMRAALQVLAAQHDIVLLTRRLPQRNVKCHASGDSTLEEITRWMLFVQPKGIGPRQILCVYHPRNLQEKWTVRFDWRLPTVSDGAIYPFCPPEEWWKASTQAHRTVRSKPAWIDKLGNGWARPNIRGGAGYHWDVFIESHAWQGSVGLDQINVVEFGAPSSEGKPGTIHHIPREKQGKLSGTGWTC